MGCLVWCLRELIELALPSAIGDDQTIVAASTGFRLKHHWFLWLHLDQYTSKVIDLHLRTNLNFLCCIFHLDASAELYRFDIFFFILITRTLDRAPSALIPIVACITQDTILIMIPIIRRYGDPHRRPQARHEIDYLEHTRRILKYIRKTHNLTWFGPNLAYVYRERTWESFINKVDT